jgi:hypothetical protein
LAIKIGEVIEAATGGFTAQCYELHNPPPFGALVRVSEGDIDIYAAVADAATTSIEPGRRPIARGGGEEAEGDVFDANPQLEKLLRTDFRALVVGHKDSFGIRQYLPPRPARIHSFVYTCEPEETAEFTRSLDYLGLLVNAGERSDELIAASLRGAAAAHGEPRDFLVGAGKELAVMLSDDTQRLNSILRRLKV